MSKEVNWQEECLKKGFEYVREPDDHYVIAEPAEMVALLRDLLGVDVRTKDCDSYGVSVCELQEQIDGLVNTLHAQQSERDALLAERDAAQKDAERYRWLLRQAWFQSAFDRYDFDDGGMQHRFERCAAEIIDAALQGEQP